MIYKGTSYEKMDDLGVAPILGNLEIYRKLQVHSSNSLIRMDTRSIKITHFFPSMFWPCTRFSEWFRADSPCLSVNSCSISYHRGCSDQLGSVNMWIGFRNTRSWSTSAKASGTMSRCWAAFMDGEWFFQCYFLVSDHSEGLWRTLSRSGPSVVMGCSI